mmetsp:Transcript_16941/g.22178  ORF Transcript_16941/g.22178 Transcript_16941/m.22178 type:complete len:361 (-) Transcript_16941:95-1177(-)
MEIVTPEWGYENSPEGNFDYILAIKEQRRLGTSRGNTAIPQAPVLQVRIKADTPGLPENAAVRAELWNYGAATKGKRGNREDPEEITKGEKLSQLRKNTYIACTHNVELFSQPAADGYRYASLSCFITRGARVISRKYHIALKLTVVVPKRGVKTTPDEVQTRNADGKWMSKTQSSKLVKPNHEDELIERTVSEIPPARTARISVSEKAMCPRECDQVKKVMNRLAKDNFIPQQAKAELTKEYLARKRKLNSVSINDSLFKKSKATFVSGTEILAAPLSPYLTGFVPNPAVPVPDGSAGLLSKQIAVYPLNTNGVTAPLLSHHQVPKFHPHNSIQNQMLNLSPGQAFQALSSSLYPCQRF